MHCAILLCNKKDLIVNNFCGTSCKVNPWLTINALRLISQAAPFVWNSLPVEIPSFEAARQFRIRLYKLVTIGYRLNIEHVTVLLFFFLLSTRFIVVLGMTLNCIHIFIVTGSFLYWCVRRPASQRFFIHSCIYLRMLIISYLTTFFGTNSLSVLMCRKAVNQSKLVSLSHSPPLFRASSVQTWLFCSSFAEADPAIFWP